MVNATIIYFVVGFITTLLVIKFGEKIPLLDLPEVEWPRAFMWTIMILVAGYAVNALLGSVFSLGG